VDAASSLPGLYAGTIIGTNIMSLNPDGAPAGYSYQAGATAYLIDPAGAYSPPTTESVGTEDGAGASASAPTLAAAGAYIPITGATSAAAEIVDPARAYSLAGASAPTADPAGPDGGAGASAPTPADSGTDIPGAGATSAATEIVDFAGTYSPAGAATADRADRHSAAAASASTRAAPGAHTPATGATSSSAAEIVDPAGAHSLAGASAATTDPADRHSAAGASAPTLAAPGAYIPLTEAASAAAKVSPAGTYLPPGATAPLADPAGTYSAAGASAPTTDPAGTYSSPYALNRLFVVFERNTPSTAVLSFNSVAAVENYYGVTSAEASLAKEFFAGYGNTSATMSFTRLGLGQRPHVLGANISNLTRTQLQSINGSLAVTFDGYTYSGQLNLSGIASLSVGAGRIAAALNSNLQVAAVTAGS
jgi:hypothetical protein